MNAKLRVTTTLMITGMLATAVLLNLSTPAATVGAQAGGLPRPIFDDENRLIRPDESYRQWTYVGTPLTPNDLNPPEAPFPEFHNVYIHPDDYSHYRRTGEFPEGTILVKELVSVGSRQAVSGNGYFMGDFVGLEAAVKDSGRFRDEPGGWAYFSFGHEYPLADRAERFPTAACSSCHQTAAADDFVFTQYYPVLRAAKSARVSSGTMTPESALFEQLVDAMTDATTAALQPTADTGPAPGAVPTSDAALLEYLRAGAYRELPYAESAPHPSAGPHTRFGRPVRVFVNEVLAASMDAGNAQHPVGSEAVKEMYLADGTLEGWAVMVKTSADGDQGRGWFWYEVTSTDAGAQPFMSGNGIPLCAGCHGSGTDQVLTRWPLR